MTDEGAPFQPGAEQLTVPLRPRGTYAGYTAFGSGDGAVLVDPRVVRELRSAAEFATQEGRVTGGLLLGIGWADDQGAYLVINGFLEAGPGESHGDRLSLDGADNFTLSDADLRLLRADAAKMYSARLELGWWRTLPVPGEFGPQDRMTQAELVGPDGVGLLVYGAGVHWGTAYLGPDGHAPDSAGTLVAEPATVSEPPPDPEAASGHELVDISAGESLMPEPLPTEEEVPPADAVPPAYVPQEAYVPQGTAAPRRLTRPRVPSRVRVPPRVRARRERPPSAGTTESKMPADVRMVVIALAVVVVVAAVIVGVLVHSPIVGVIIAVVGLVALFAAIRSSRR